MRMLAAGAIAFVASGVAVGAGAPAYAQDSEADLAIELVGTTVAEGAAGKFATLTLSNDGPDDASGIQFTYDLSALDTDKVNILLEGCTADGSGTAVCIIDPDGLENGEHVNFLDFLEVVPGSTGDAGSITMTISHAGTDPDESDNSVTADVSIGEAGPDLLAIAPDVRYEVDADDGYAPLDTEIVPGSDALVTVFVANQGSVATGGTELSIELPEHVTFALEEPSCTHAAGDSSTTCDYETFALQPGYAPDESENYCGESGTCAWFWFPVNVAADAPSPASLKGGHAEASDMGQVLPFSAQSTQLPSNVSTEAPVDADLSDNSSEFTVFVTEPGGSGGSSDDDGLPVTGSPVVLFAGIGAGVLAAGGLMFFFARRRRVVVATPDSDG